MFDVGPVKWNGEVELASGSYKVVSERVVRQI